MRWLCRLLSRLLTGTPLPEGFDGTLDGDERVLASAPVRGGGHLVVTTLGLWVPEDGGRHRRIGWHLVSTARWDGRVLTVIEADEVGTVSMSESAGDSVGDPVGDPVSDAVLIADRPPLRFALPEPATVPELVHTRVTRSVLHSERRSTGDLVVRRRVPGRDGVQVQVRRDTT
jgi:hypothetical protein